MSYPDLGPGEGADTI